MNYKNDLEIDKVTIGNNIRRLREDKKITQEALGKYLNVSKQAVSNWERGEKFPDISLLRIIANYLNCTVSELLSCDDDEINSKIDELFMELHFGDPSCVEDIVKNIIDLAPNRPNILYRCALALRDIDEELCIDLCNRILYTTENMELRSGAYSILIDLYSKRNSQSAIRYSNELVSFFNCKELNELKIWSGFSLERVAQSNIAKFVDGIDLSIHAMLKSGMYSEDDAIQILTFTILCIVLMIMDGPAGKLPIYGVY